MSANFAAILYLAAGVLFILALRGLSSPATSREGNRYGMIGMAVAVATSTPVDSNAPTTITDEMAFVTDNRGVCSAGVTDQTT